jgi:hypothetical protein
MGGGTGPRPPPNLTYGKNETRTWCYFVGYMFGPATFYNGEPVPGDDDPPTRTAQNIVKRLTRLIHEYCPDVRFVPHHETVVHSTYYEKLLRLSTEQAPPTPKLEAELLGRATLVAMEVPTPGHCQ